MSGQQHAPAALYPWERPVTHCTGGWVGRSGQARKISPPTGIRFPDCPARSQSLYQLSYPAHVVPGGARNFLLYGTVQPVSGAHPASSGYQLLFYRGKLAGA
jgi:hypothetical protein